ncbi:hypothetical protein G7Y79_00036g072650 [Physcia stellaris]|nr:hypothetical protein G7Y79_00036g072650 [Physcia stellaris]
MLRFPVFLLLVAAAQCIPSSPLSTRLRASTRLGAPISECASLPNYPQWFQPSEKFDNGDCSRAISIFYHDYVKDHGPIPYEFLTSGVDPVHGIPTQRVPLKVGFGTCKLAIAMRSEFRWGDLPGERPFRSARSDVSSFANLYRIVEDINSKCAEHGRVPGWHAAGDLDSIGVFLWQAASPINQRIRARTGIIVKPSNTTRVASSSLHDTA